MGRREAFELLGAVEQPGWDRCSGACFLGAVGVLGFLAEGGEAAVAVVKASGGRPARAAAPGDVGGS